MIDHRPAAIVVRLERFDLAHGTHDLTPPVTSGRPSTSARARLILATRPPRAVEWLRSAVVVEGGPMSFSSEWPIKKPVADTGIRAGAQTAKLAIAQRIEVLARVPLFAGLGKRQMQTMARACSSHRWPAGSRIVVEGSMDQSCFVIVEGNVDVLRGGRSIAQLGPGDFFGEIALLDPGPRSATVTTATEVVAVELSRTDFLDVSTGDPQILLRMLEALARRVRETTEKLSD